MSAEIAGHFKRLSIVVNAWLGARRQSRILLDLLTRIMPSGTTTEERIVEAHLGDREHLPPAEADKLSHKAFRWDRKCNRAAYLVRQHGR
jgi:hypothetical protein